MTEATNATPAAPAIPVSTNPNIVYSPVSFFFKKDELGNKRPTINLALPYLTMEGLITALGDEKQAKLILDMVNDEIIYGAARQQVNDEQSPVNEQSQLDLTKLTLEFIANLPPAERRGGGIPKEVWEAFSKDYLAIMPAVTGKTADQVGNAVKLHVAKYQPCKTNKKVLKVLQDQLAVYTANTQNLEEFGGAVEFLNKKLETLLQADEAALLANL